MGGVFLKTLNMSIAASWLILAVILLRFLLKKAPKWVAVLLWGIVALRLAVPFSYESALSLIPSAETFSAHNIQYETPAISSGIPAVNHAVNPVLGEVFAPNPGASVNPLYVWTEIAAVVWLAGLAAMLLYAAVSYVRVRRSVAESAPCEGNIFLSDHVRSPFILGLVRPRIYLPSGISAASMEPVIAHEKAHLARRDHWWKPLGFLILAVHWFNPLCWAAYVLLCRDIELACDEKVVRRMDLAGKKLYSTALLECSAGRRLVSVCPLAFGEVGVKERVKHVLNYKKPAFWVIAAAAAACAMVTVCFATDPKQDLLQEQHTVQARITEVESRSFLAVPVGGDSELSSGGLRTKYPEYFGLETFKGLEVYVWQMAKDSYRFGLMQGTDREKTLEELMGMKGASAEEMALILSSYNIEDEDIFVIPWQNPISSYMVTEEMVKDPEYISNIRAMLGLDGGSAASAEETASDHETPAETLKKISAEETADAFGIPIVLPKNANWIEDAEYDLMDENHLRITYHDLIADADCTLLVLKNADLDLPPMDYDEALNETWEGSTAGGRYIAVNVRHEKDNEKMTLAVWEYKEYRFAIMGEDDTKAAIPKVALAVIENLD